MTDLELKYEQLKQADEQLKEAVTKMLAAQADARKNKTVQQKWVIANNWEKKVQELINPKPKTTTQATFDWLAQ